MCPAAKTRSGCSMSLVLQGCHNAVPEMAWLIAPETNAFTVRRPEVGNQVVSRATSLWHLSGTILPRLFLGPGGCQQSLEHLLLALTRHPIPYPLQSTSVVSGFHSRWVRVFLLFIRTPTLLNEGYSLVKHDLISASQVTSATTPLPNKITF